VNGGPSDSLANLDRELFLACGDGAGDPVGIAALGGGGVDIFTVEQNAEGRVGLLECAEADSKLWKRLVAGYGEEESAAVALEVISNFNLVRYAVGVFDSDGVVVDLDAGPVERQARNQFELIFAAGVVDAHDEVQGLDGFGLLNAVSEVADTVPEFAGRDDLGAFRDEIFFLFDGGIVVGETRGPFEHFGGFVHAVEQQGGLGDEAPFAS